MESVKETKEALQFAIALANAVANGLEDGKIGLEDIGGLLATLQYAEPAIKDISKIKAEMLDLDGDEKNELLDVVALLHLNVESREIVAKGALKLALDIAELVAMLKK